MRRTKAIVNDRQEGYLPTLLGKRREFIQLAGVAVGLSLGVNLVADAIASSLPARSTLIVGLATIFAIVLALAVWAFHSVSLSRTIEACIFVGAEEDIMLPLPSYEFSQHVFDALEAGLDANPELRERWRGEAAFLMRTIDTSKSYSALWSKDAARKLVRDAVEIVLFDYLSDSLRKTLKLSGTDPKFIVTQSPSKFPGLVMGNELMAAHASGHAIAITVPAGSLLTRPSSHTLTLYSPRLRLTLAIEYTGENAYVPAGTLKRYFAEELHIRPQLVSIRVKCDASPAALFQARYWEQYAWIDEFLQKLDRVEYSRFFVPH